MKADLYQRIEKPTLLVDESKACANIRKMVAKAAAQKIRFRPHFKTHQSARIGEWFRAEGVTAITVSSLSMADYFAKHGWGDILVAFPVNLREMDTIRRLSEKIRLGLLVEALHSVRALAEALESQVDIWVKIDTGLHRTGLDAAQPRAVAELIAEIQQHPKFRLRGLLTHAGQTYHAGSVQEIRDLYTRSWQALAGLREALHPYGIGEMQLSIGDTPGCWLREELGQVDEIRPGNFVFFDSMMVDLGVCSVDEVAVAMACPVVALHPERNEAVIYGGAVHLSKDALQNDGRNFYGYAVLLTEQGWQFAGHENRVIGLSQEHGVLRLETDVFSRLKVGDLIGVLPAHSCLAVDAQGKYLSLEGEEIFTYLSSGA